MQQERTKYRLFTSDYLRIRTGREAGVKWECVWRYTCWNRESNPQPLSPESRDYTPRPIQPRQSSQELKTKQIGLVFYVQIKNVIILEPFTVTDLLSSQSAGSGFSLQLQTDCAVAAGVIVSLTHSHVPTNRHWHFQVGHTLLRQSLPLLSPLLSRPNTSQN